MEMVTAKLWEVDKYGEKKKVNLATVGLCIKNS